MAEVLISESRAFISSATPYCVRDAVAVLPLSER